jgi:hypothetical protein
VDEVQPERRSMTITISSKTGTVIVSLPKVPKPKLKYQFRLLFKTVTGILDETSKALTQNVLKVSAFEEPMDNLFGLINTASVKVTFQDDIEDQVYDGIKVLQASEELEFYLEYLNGDDTVLRRFKFIEPKIDTVKYSTLDYELSERVVIEMTVNYTGLTKEQL